MATTTTKSQEAKKETASDKKNKIILSSSLAGFLLLFVAMIILGFIYKSLLLEVFGIVGAYFSTIMLLYTLDGKKTLRFILEVGIIAVPYVLLLLAALTA